MCENPWYPVTSTIQSTIQSTSINLIINHPIHFIKNIIVTDYLNLSCSTFLPFINQIALWWYNIDSYGKWAVHNHLLRWFTYSTQWFSIQNGPNWFHLLKEVSLNYHFTFFTTFIVIYGQDYNISPIDPI